MKTLLLIVLCGVMLLDGCYTYSVLERDDKEQQIPPDNENIIVTLKNGSVIESEALHHVFVNAPSNFIYGVGTSMKRFLAKEQNYSGGIYIGRIDASMIDSSKLWIYEGPGYRDFWLKDSLRIRFAEGDYFTVTPEQGTGFWCIGQKSNGISDTKFAGKIVYGNMRTIEAKYFSVATLVLAGVGVLVAIGLATMLYYLSQV